MPSASGRQVDARSKAPALYGNCRTQLVATARVAREHSATSEFPREAEARVLHVDSGASLQLGIDPGDETGM